MIFETHAHYEDEKFDTDREILLAQLEEQGISPVVNVGSSLETTKKSIQLARQYAFIYAAIGIHPSDIADLNEDTIRWLQAQASDEKVVAIGEIGLDYYWTKQDYEEQSKQRYWFGRQLELARDTGLPVIIHSRDAAEDTYHIMAEHHAEEIGGVVHCFSYSLEMARKFVKMGFYIGVGGVVTFKNAKKLKEVVMHIPLDKIVLETDCPYMAPEPFRGKRNSSLYLPYVVSKIAELKEISEDEVVAVTEKNARKMYRLM